MKRQFSFVFALSAILLLAETTSAGAQQPRGTGVAPPDFASAKTLYASASYEEALTSLAAIESTEDVNEVEQYRALCLLALGRTSDAERALERIVSRKPLYVIKDVSPKLITMFREVRARLLPLAARDLYTTAKANFDEKKYDDAFAQFGEMLAILSDPDLSDQGAALADMKLLGDGFRKLSEAQLAATKVAAQPAAPSTASSPAPLAPRSETETTSRVYSNADKDVKVPVEVVRRLPLWTPPNPVALKATHRGVLEIVIDAQGAVESAVLRESVADFYDALLIEATKSWRFRPATKNGVPVRYRRLIEITLAPGGKS